MSLVCSSVVFSNSFSHQETISHRGEHHTQTYLIRLDLVFLFLSLFSPPTIYVCCVVRCDFSQVFERGLTAIPLSVDLWIHYLTYIKQNNADDEPIRHQFERALSSCGLEFRSDKLWDAYIKWESDAKRMSNVVAVYDRLLATPTQGYNSHFDGLVIDELDTMRNNYCFCLI